MDALSERKEMDSCMSCYWYFKHDGICCCPDSECRAATPEEFSHDPKEYACHAYKEGEFWS